MERVTVTNPVIGICHMQVCAVADATDKEILEVANRENPSGTRAGWAEVIRASGEFAQGPVDCEKVSGRVHYLLSC